MIKLPEEYISRMKEQLGAQFPDYMLAMGRPPSRGLRVNTLKVSISDFSELFPYGIKPTGIVPEGFLLDVPSIGNHVLHRAGLFYMQEPSSARPAALLGVKPGMRVLDLCAAPGGKAGQIAAYLKGDGILIANEIIPERARVLSHTLERLGVKNAVITCMKPDALCSILRGCLDAVLVDAPCSGEGMFRKEPKAVQDWSAKHVRACARRQSALLDSAAIALKPGGKLVYSTCTFSNEENEDTVRAFITRSPGCSLMAEERFYPHTGPGEGQYMALIKKESGTGKSYIPASIKPVAAGPAKAYYSFIRDNMTIEPEGSPYLLKSGRLMLLPRDMPPDFAGMRIISAGVHMGDIRNDMFIPAHGLVMAYKKSDFVRTYDLTEEQAALYFRGEGFCAGGEGYFAACAHKQTAGLIKASGGFMKCLLPKGLRGEILM